MSEISYSLMVLWLAILWDLTIGDLPSAVHPVAWMGKAISLFQAYAPRRGRWLPFFAGAAFMLGGILCCASLGVLLLVGLKHVPVYLAIASEAIALKCMFSISGLLRASVEVQSALHRHDLVEARRLVSWHLVSRDTSQLDESQVAAATIESISENASDSCIAPLFFYAVGGLPAVLAYRFINTCDAMLGYRDAEREWLGKAAARIDDLVNLIPARVTAAMILFTGPVVGTSPIRASSIWFRDRKLTASPNAGHPMSAAAGVLGVELEKVGHYQLGFGQRKPDETDIRRARTVLGCTTFFALLVFSGMIYWIR